MPKPIPLAIRRQIVERHQKGESLMQIAHELERPYESVRNVWRLYRAEGRLVANYAVCGRRGVRCHPKIYRAARLLKRWHPTWGAPLIRTLIVRKWPHLEVPHARTLQRWFRTGGVPRRPQSRQVRHTLARGKEPHAVWELDSKEQIVLSTGERVSWLLVSDEASGAVLKGTVFPHRLRPSVECGTSSDELAGVF